MDLYNALKKKKISQRELGRRLGYESNGVVSGVLCGRISIPQDDIPKWADALGLEGGERAAFIEEESSRAIPTWVRQQIADLRAELRLRDDILGTGFPVEVTDRDREL